MRLFQQREKPGVDNGEIGFELSRFSLPGEKGARTDFNLHHIGSLFLKKRDIAVDVGKMAVTGEDNRLPERLAAFIGDRGDGPAVFECDGAGMKFSGFGQFAAGPELFQAFLQIRKRIRDILPGHCRLFGIVFLFVVGCGFRQPFLQSGKMPAEDVQRHIKIFRLNAVTCGFEAFQFSAKRIDGFKLPAVQIGFDAGDFSGAFAVYPELGGVVPFGKRIDGKRKGKPNEFPRNHSRHRCDVAKRLFTGGVGEFHGKAHIAGRAGEQQRSRQLFRRRRRRHCRPENRFPRVQQSLHIPVGVFGVMYAGS